MLIYENKFLGQCARFWYLSHMRKCLFLNAHNEASSELEVNILLRAFIYIRMYVSSEGSGECAHMRRLAWAFAANWCDTYEISFTCPNFYLNLTASRSK